MKVFCIKHSGADSYKYLTKGKWYEVNVDETDKYGTFPNGEKSYLIQKDDIGLANWHMIDQFITEQEYRDIKLKEILTEGNSDEI